MDAALYVVLMSEAVVAGGDATAPTLSSATATATGATTADLSVDTDEGNGTLYWVVTTSATGPSAAQVKAGQDHTGVAATDSGSQAVSGTGTQNVSGGATGLTGGTTYYAHYMHEDSSANQSSVDTTSALVLLLSGLVAYWAFDEASGNAADAVASNDLAQNGTVGRTTGKINNCATSFSDANYFSIGDNEDIDLYDKDFSWSLWVGNSTAGIKAFLCKGTAYGAGTSQIVIGRTTSGAAGVYCEISSGAANTLITGEAISTTFRHVLVTFAKATKLLQIFVNGTKYTKTISAAVPDAGGDMLVGRFYATTFSAGADIDELGFWNRVLTDDEVAELYNAGAGNAYPFTAPT